MLWRLILANPYIAGGLVLALVLAVVGFGAYEHHQGALSERAEWVEAQQKLDDLAQKKLDAANAATRDREKAIAALQQKVGEDYEKNRAAVDAAYRRGLSSGGVFIDRGATCQKGGGSGVPQGGAAAADTPAAPAGCRLSDQARDFLRGLAWDADRAAIYAQAGSQYAVGLPAAVRDGTMPPR